MCKKFAILKCGVMCVTYNCSVDNVNFNIIFYVVSPI